ncbi:peroxin 8 [Daldinia sp. FL1419]|nr:peroxin 8 [Daldinia sp. FL1419]
MPGDRLLATVLRAYQNVPNPTETDKIFATTTSLLASLNNPLNLSLLTSHFLTARSIWESPDGLRTCLRIISVYNTAAIHVRKNELENASLPHGRPPVGSGVHSEDWARAIAKGTDDRSGRWQHVLVLTGILMGMEGDDRRSLSRGLRSTLEQAVVTASNLALQDPIRTGVLGRGAVVLALTFAFPFLHESAKQLLNGNVLLPATVDAMLGDEGLQHGDFIASIANDIAPGQAINWNPDSPSVARLQKLESRPLAQNMGPLSRLASFAVQHAMDPNVVIQAQDALLGFTAALLNKWTHCPLSAIDLTVESAALSPEVLTGPWPALWQLLKKILYTVAATAQAVVSRSLLDPYLRSNAVAPTTATKTLHILRNMAFISTRQGASSFRVYTFTYLTSLDVITRYPDACVSFLRDTQPPSPQTSNVVPSPVIQALALFYLNTAEHFPLSLPTRACEDLIIAPTTAYLSPSTSWLASPANSPPSSLTLELFEAAHSAVLSSLSCPQHSGVAASLIPFYVDALLSSFPVRISSRQFRLAFRTVMQISSPPFPLSASHPDLAEVLLETLRFRAVEGASTDPLPPPPNEQPAAAGAAPTSPEDPVSEQSGLVLALVDALPYVPLPAVEEWLARTAETMNAIENPRLRDGVRRRFWDVLVNGEMDVERAAIGVAWWGTAGGKEMVLHGLPRPEERSGGEFMMSGALIPPGQEREMSRL